MHPALQGSPAGWFSVKLLLRLSLLNCVFGLYCICLAISFKKLEISAATKEKKR